MFLMLILTIPIEENIIEFNKQENYTYIIKETTSISKIYNKKYIILTILIFIYLLITIIVISKIIKIYKGPLRSTK